MAEPPVGFAGVLRQLRAEAALTQEELAEAAGLNPRTISDLERGLATTPHKDTVRLLADALQLGGSARVEFEAAARGHTVPGRAHGRGVAAAPRTLPRDVASFTGRQHELRAHESDSAGESRERTPPPKCPSALPFLASEFAIIGGSTEFLQAFSLSGCPFELVAREGVSVDACATPGFELGEHSGEVVADGSDYRCV